MEETMAARYWCHACSQIVSPIMGMEMKCSVCQSGFIEEMSSATGINDLQNVPENDFGSDRSPSLWAPILLGMMGNPRLRQRLRRMELEEDYDSGNHDGDNGNGGVGHYDRELESILRRRRRSSATIQQLLQGIRAGLTSETHENIDRDDRVREREREHVILINPFNQTIIVQGSYDSNRDQSDNNNPIGSLGDYFVGPGLDLLLQHLSENDPNRYGTPPAPKEAVEGLPTVKINENMQCSVCLDDFEVGSDAKEMPCKHRFHSACILPWLELHSSCPVCRSQLRVDDPKQNSDVSRNNRNQRENENIGHASAEGDSEGRSASGGRRFSFPWPFNGLFSSSSSSSSSSNANGNSSQPERN
ncbi:E3 ubiquitin-protein ligase SIRP1-like [Vicia villosa]|uniref:E3 ubiquitin-protein ligase SIRP1-like n=1 Tax=Vicia villosa TaxID=3911 RepID=UPI00273C6C42|nr:E3 ubiquitin-protein ligase SIRP1-like [Vicia villosa]XP_058787182.1 E3 ubiquitin-protein ligase SIRP1-like [Vicia villosa]